MSDAANGENGWQISWDAPLRTARAQAAALTSTTDAVCRLDREWRFTLVNAAAERLLGHPASDLVDHCVWDVFPDWVGRDLYEALHEAVEHRVPVSLFTLEARWRRWFEVRAFPDATGLSVFFRDVDELRRTAQEQAARTELLRAALEVSPAGTVLLDAEGTILATNRQWYAFGERKGEARELRAPGTSYHDAALRHVTPFDARTLQRGSRRSPRAPRTPSPTTARFRSRGSWSGSTSRPPGSTTPGGWWSPTPTSPTGSGPRRPRCGAPGTTT